MTSIEGSGTVLECGFWGAGDKLETLVEETEVVVEERDMGTCLEAAEIFAGEVVDAVLFDEVIVLARATGFPLEPDEIAFLLKTLDSS